MFDNNSNPISEADSTSILKSSSKIDSSLLPESPSALRKTFVTSVWYPKSVFSWCMLGILSILFLKYFAFWTALADLGLYVLAVKRLGELKEQYKADPTNAALKEEYGKFVATRIITMVVIYALAIGIAYLIPSYRANPYYIWGLPLGLLFSASFMFAGIQQLPLQIFWKMEKLSITLITARLSQLVILLPVVYLLFKRVDFMSGPTTVSVIAFCLILFSVV